MGEWDMRNYNESWGRRWGKGDTRSHLSPALVSKWVPHEIYVAGDRGGSKAQPLADVTFGLVIFASLSRCFLIAKMVTMTLISQVTMLKIPGGSKAHSSLHTARHAIIPHTLAISFGVTWGGV